MPSGRRALALVGLALLSVPSLAHAEPTAADQAAAQALFDEAKGLMQKGNYAEACPKFAESQRLDPAGGTLLALGLCHEGAGKTASAWAEFTQAATLARLDHRPDRENAANEHIKAIEPRLTRFRIVAPEIGGLEVRRDGELLGRASWSTPVPIDPGDYAFEARAPLKRAWRDIVPIKGEGKIVDVKIPPLEDAPLPAATPTPQPKPAPTTPTTPEPAPEPHRSVVLPLIVGGAGLVLLGVGSAFGISAMSKWSDAKKLCPTHPACTSADAKTKAEDAGKAANVSTALFVVGGVAVAAAAVLYFVVPSDDPRGVRGLRVAPTIGTNGAGLSLGGAL